MEYGYVRVSTDKQHLERQIDAMIELGISEENIFVDQYTGANFGRPEYQKMLAKIQKNDILFVDDLFRFGRDYEEIKNNWEHINKEIKADIVVMDNPILDTRPFKDLLGTLITDVVLSVLSYAAQHSRENMLRVQAGGIEKAKKRGVVFGRPRTITMDEFEIEYMRVREGSATAQELQEEMDISKTTYYRYVKQLEKIRKEEPDY